MTKHVTEWLGAYLDGELRGSHLRQVEAHLAGCEFCRAELKALENVSDALQDVPGGEFSPPERLAAQVSLRLPHQQVLSRRRILEIGWWMVPVGLLAAWVFVSTSSLITDLLSAVNYWSLLNSSADWLKLSPASQASWVAAVEQLGIPGGTGLDWAASAEAFVRTSLPGIIKQIYIALLYVSWIVIWWTRHTRQQPVESTQNERRSAL